MNIMLAGALVFGSTVGLLPSQVYAAPDNVEDLVVNEVNSSSNDDWVEIYNAGTASIGVGQLEKLTVEDGDGNSYDLSNDTPLASGAYLLVYMSNRLNNPGDSVMLVYDSNESIDSVDYGTGSANGAPESGETLSRLPNGTGSFAITNQPTPGEANQASQVAAPVVNAENFNTHSGGDYKGLNVGFNIQDFGEVTGVSVRLYDGPGNVLAENTHNSNLLNLINNDGATQLSTPFIIENGTYVEEYWDFETNTLSSGNKPATAKIFVTDASGTYEAQNSLLSEATASYESLFPPDTSAPQVVYVSPENGEVTDSTDVSVDISDETNVTQYNFRINGPVTWDTYKTKPNQKNVDVNDYNLCENARVHSGFGGCSDKELPSGTYHVDTLAYDGQGNDSRSEPGINIIIDNDHPEGQFVHTNEPQNNTGVIEVEIEDVGEAGLGQQQIVMRNDEGVVKGNFFYHVETGATRVDEMPDETVEFNYDGNTKSGTLEIAFDTTLLEEGVYNLRLFTKDQLRNGQSAIYGNVAIDNMPPALPSGLRILKGHSANAPNLECNGYTNTTQIRIDWNDNQEEDLAGYWFGVKGNEKHRWVNADRSYYDGNMTPGRDSYSYTIIAVDNVGNESEATEPCGVILDQEAPVAKITSPAMDGAEVSGEVTVVGEITDEDNPMNSFFRITGPSGYEETWFDESGLSTYEIKWNTEAEDVEDGEYTIFFAARDKAGNKDGDRNNPEGQSVDSITVTVNNSSDEDSGETENPTTGNNDNEKPQTDNTNTSNNQNNGNAGNSLNLGPVATNTQASLVASVFAANGFVVATNNGITNQPDQNETDNSENEQNEDTISLNTNESGSNDNGNQSDVAGAQSNMLSNWWWLLAVLLVTGAVYVVYRKAQTNESN